MLRELMTSACAVVPLQTGAAMAPPRARANAAARLLARAVVVVLLLPLALAAPASNVTVQ